MSRFMPKIIALAAAGILLSACGQVTERATESIMEGVTGADIEMTDEGMTITDGDASMTVDVEGESVTLTDESGKSTFQTGEGAQIPDSFPSDLPTPSGGELSTVSETPEGLMLIWGFDRFTSAEFDRLIADIQSAGYSLVGDVITMDSGDDFNRVANLSGKGKVVMVTGGGSSDFGQVSILVTDESP
jgi:hypothetical protein